MSFAFLFCCALVQQFTGRFDSGGGFSDVFKTPAYQQAAVADYLNSVAVRALHYIKL
jgi:subtilase family serine protease